MWEAGVNDDDAGTSYDENDDDSDDDVNISNDDYNDDSDDMNISYGVVLRSVPHRVICSCTAWSVGFT